MDKNLLPKLLSYFYRAVYFVLLIPVSIVKYFFLGFVFMSKIIFWCFKYSVSGFLVAGYVIFKYPLIGLITILKLISFLWQKLIEENRKMYAAQLERKRKQKEAKKLSELRSAEEKRRKIDEENKKRLAAMNAKKEAEEAKKAVIVPETASDGRRKRVVKEVAEDEEKKKIGDYINDFLETIFGFPKRLKNKNKKKEEVNALAKAEKRIADINREALLINFDGEDAEKSEKKILYEYVARSPEGQLVKDYFQAFSKVEVHSFLLSEGYEVYSIKTNQWIQLMHGNVGKSAGKIKIKDLIFFLTQLSTYIKAGIPLVDALKILSRQFKNKTYKRIFKAMMYNLTMGDNFSEAMSKQENAFPKLLINMVKTSELTGELPETLDDMANYYTETEKTKSQMKTAMIYPTIVLIMSIGVVIFMLLFVVPQFTEIYASMGEDKVPAFTQAVIGTSAFIKSYAIWILLGIVLFILTCMYLFKNVKIVRALFQRIAMRIPVFGDVIIYNEVTMFTKTFSSLLSHNVFITDSMEVLNKITNNEVYKLLILDTINNLAKGERISLAFKDHWAFPVPAYEMLVTGEMTGQLPEMMATVSAYYQELHRQSVARIKTVLEPALLVFLTAVVGTILLAVMIPMFSMYEGLSNEASGS